MSVAEGVSQKDAINSVTHLWDPVKHPRGRDGKYIETGGFVQVFDGPGGPQIASGKVTAAYKAPDGRTFVGVDVGGGKIVWHRPKQIESVEVKGWLGPKPKSVLDGGQPDAPLPSVPEKFGEIHWTDEPDYDPASLTKAATDTDGAWSPHVSKLGPWLTEHGYDPQVNDVYSEETDNYSLIHVSGPDNSYETFDASNNNGYIDKSDDPEELWAKVQLGIAEQVHAADQPGGVPETEKTGIALIGDVPWKHPDDWPAWLASVGLNSDTTVYQSEGNPEQLLTTDGIEAAVYKKGHLVDDIPIDTAQWAIEYGTGPSTYTKVFDPKEDTGLMAKLLAESTAEVEAASGFPGPEDPYWPGFVKSNNLNPETQIVTNGDNNELYTIGPHSEHAEVWVKDVGGAITKTGDTMSLDDVSDGSMDGLFLAVWPPLEGVNDDDFPDSDFVEVAAPEEGWQAWLSQRAMSDATVYISQTGNIYVHPSSGSPSVLRFKSTGEFFPDPDELPASFIPEMLEGGDWAQAWPPPEVDNTPVAEWLEKLGVPGASVYQVPEQTGVYIVLPGFGGSDQPGTAWWSPDGILADQVEVAALAAIEVENYYEIDQLYSPPKPAAPSEPDELMEWEKELMEGVPEPAPVDPSAWGPVLHIPAATELQPGSILYHHPQGATIIAAPGGTVTKYTAAGKKAATSATAAKLLAGHGAWTQAGVVDSDFQVQMYTGSGIKVAKYDPAIGAYTLAPGGVSQKEMAEDPDLYVEPPTTPPVPPPPPPALDAPPGAVPVPLIGKTPTKAWVDKENPVAFVEVDGQVWSTYESGDWALSNHKPSALDSSSNLVPATYVAGSPNGGSVVFPIAVAPAPGPDAVPVKAPMPLPWADVTEVWITDKPFKGTAIIATQYAGEDGPTVWAQLGSSKWTVVDVDIDELADSPTAVPASYDPATNSIVPLASAPTPAPAAPSGPAFEPIKLPKGKTAFDLLWMINTSFVNKNPDQVFSQTKFAEALTDVLSLNTGYDAALKKLNALMTQAKLGGKQRARYKTLLMMHYGVTPAPGSSEKSAIPGDPGKWQVVKPPNGYTAGVTNFVQGNNLIKTGGNTAGTAKANIQENLSKRLVGRVTMEQMVAAVKDSDFNSSGALIELTDKATGWKPSDGGHLSKGGHLGIWKWSPHSNMNSIPATKENFERAMRESLTSQLVNMWAGSSNDSNPRSLAMQVAAQVEFGLKDTYDWPTDQAKTKKEYDKHGPLFRQFLRVMYENTQDWGKANGVKYVKLKRGMSWGANVAQVGVGVDHDVQLRPMSSFTSNSSTASGFSGGYVIEAVVPIEWIIGTAATGFGCQSEYEWVILGGKHKMRRVK